MSESESKKGTAFGVAYAISTYFVGHACFAYFILFLNGIWVPKTIDDGPVRSLWSAVVINTGLVVLWALQHSVMARPAFKRRWTRWIPAHTERTTYCLASSIMLAIAMVGWAPTEGVVWAIEGAVGRSLIYGLGALGWIVLFTATFEIDHFELFGVKQPMAAWRGVQLEDHAFQARRIYRFVRHPIQTGLLFGMWAAPTMTVTHLMFATLMTVYIIVGLYFEERDLVRRFGDRYLRYQQEVPMLLPLRAPAAAAQPRDAVRDLER